ncbi:Mlp family lipoprotein [Borreliella garinii]
MKTQLDKCNENDEGKNTFKEIVKAALGGNNIDNVNHATCNSQF